MVSEGRQDNPHCDPLDLVEVDSVNVAVAERGRLWRFAIGDRRDMLKCLP